MVQNLQRRQQEDDASLIQSDSSGGLNIMSSAMTIPLKDSPSMGNTEVNQRGHVQKRYGSQTLAFFDNQNSGGISGTVLETIKLRNLPSLVVAKVGLDITTFSYLEQTTNNFRTITSFGSSISFSEVFSERARYVKPDTVQTSELEPRIIFTTGVNPPIQTKFVQSISFDITYSSGSDESTIQFDNTNLANADTTNIFVFDDGVDITSELVSTSFSDPTLSVTVNGDRTGSEMSVVFVSWQWWAEATSALGKRAYQRKTKFNTKELDKIINVPTEILTGIRPLQNVSNLRYPIIPAIGNAYTSQSSLDLTYTLTPQQEEEYILSQAGQFDLNVDTEVLPGLDVIAFGSIRRSSGTPTDELEPLHFYRGLPVLFNGGRGIEAQNMTVFVDDTEYTQNTDGTTSSPETYYLKDESIDYFSSPISNNSTQGQFIDFMATDPMGVDFTALIQAVHSTPEFLGGSATSVKDKYGQGTYVPAFGFWEICDYQEGSFPRTVAVIQGRLAFGGTPKQPLKVAVSEVFDAANPGSNFRDYQTLISDQEADEAFQFELQAELNDKITAMEEFNNQLFIFTNNSTFRLTGGGQGLSPSNFAVQFQVGIGCVNSRSVERIENTMYFMNQNGIFDISGTQDASEYASAERSLKIRQFFSNNLFDEESSWMQYDPSTSRLYVGLSSDRDDAQEDNPWTAERLLVYNVFRDAWTQFESVEGRFFSVDAAIVTKKDSQSAPIFYHIPWLDNYYDSEGSPEYALITVFDEFRPVDYLTFRTLQSDQTAPWYQKLDKVPYKRLNYRLAKGRYFYPVNTVNSQTSYGHIFGLLPHREVEDVKVEVDYELNGNYQRLTFNEDFVKFENGGFEQGIYLLSVVPDDTKQIRITKISEPENTSWNGDIHPIRVWRDNVLLIENTDYVINFTSDGFYEVEFKNDVSSGSVIEFGYTYDAWFYSPKFFRANLGSYKRFLHWYGYFYNDPYNEVYSVNDANAVSGQDPTEITGSYPVAVGFNLVFNYDDTEGGFTTGDADLYGTLDLFWDKDTFDISPQFNPLTRVAEPIIGASYNFQVGLLSNRGAYFEQVGYQLTLLQKGETRDAPRNQIQAYKF